MTASQYDYEEDIRKLMEDLTVNDNDSEPQPAPPANERKGAVRLSGVPVATSISDLPLILGDVARESTDTEQTKSETEKEIALILPSDDAVGEVRQDDFNEAEFIRQYINAQIADNEAGGYDDARRASFFGRQFFRRGDAPIVLLGKSLFWFVILVFVGALVYGAYVLGVQPLIAARQEQHLMDVYDPDASGTVSDHENSYPQGMLVSFRGLYDINPQVSGYLQYHAEASDDFLQINYPVAYSGDNTTYLHKNFYGDTSADGALFIDERCNSEDSPLTIVYGKNAANGKMFAGLNSLVGSVYSARTAAKLTYSTLFEKKDYHVFAVVLSDASSNADGLFDCCRTDFSSDEELDTYIEAVKARSLFDYGISVTASDDILVLVTDASTSVSKMNNARIAVYARRVQGDGPTGSLIVKNDDVIMPLAWYTAQKIKPHAFYESAAQPSGGSTTARPSTDDDTSSNGTTSSVTESEGTSGSTTTGAPIAGATTTTALGTTTTDGTTGATQTHDATTAQGSGDSTDTTSAPNNTSTADTTQTTPPSSHIGRGDDGVIEMDELI